MFVFNDSTGYI